MIRNRRKKQTSYEKHYETLALAIWNNPTNKNKDKLKEWVEGNSNKNKGMTVKKWIALNGVNTTESPTKKQS